MLSDEIPLVIKCKGKQLVAILHKPCNPVSTGLLLIVGGPQYRVGSHRQFILLARKLAENGIPVFRFDYRAMGDSEGGNVQFDDIESDISAAIDAFYFNLDGLNQVVLWGLCDAASASLFYAYKDVRIKGIVILNPWVRTEAGEARTYIKHYYFKRLLNKEFWIKVINGKWNLSKSFSEIYYMANKLLKPTRSDDQKSSVQNIPLPDRMLAGLEKFNGDTLIILSGQDYVADEFRDVVSSSEKWKCCLGNPRTTTYAIDDANHTFSSKEWRNQVENRTIDWIKNLSTT